MSTPSERRRELERTGKTERERRRQKALEREAVERIKVALVARGFVFTCDPPGFRYPGGRFAFSLWDLVSRGLIPASPEAIDAWLATVEPVR